MRRFTRLTNAFSKKLENHACAVALHSMMYYNFVRLQQTLKVSLAMAAGVASISRTRPPTEAALKGRASALAEALKVSSLGTMASLSLAECGWPM